MGKKQKYEEKQLYRHFKQQISEISREKTWTWLRKRSLKRETESLLIAVHNNPIKISYVKTRIDQTQQNNNVVIETKRLITLENAVNLRKKSIRLTHWCNGLSVLQWPGRLGFNPRSSHTKDFKNGTWCLLASHSAL